MLDLYGAQVDITHQLCRALCACALCVIYLGAGPVRDIPVRDIPAR